jgi:hypothetical protein
MAIDFDPLVAGIFSNLKIQDALAPVEADRDWKRNFLGRQRHSVRLLPCLARTSVQFVSLTSCGGKIETIECSRAACVMIPL